MRVRLLAIGARWDVQTYFTLGFGVPRMEFLGPREQLVTFAERKDSGELAEYWARKNARSMDGLPGLESPNTTQTSRMMERRNANKVVGE